MISVPEYAMLPENRSGFWVHKLPQGDRYLYAVCHQGMAEFGNSISEAKQRLHLRSEKLFHDRQAIRAIASIGRITQWRDKDFSRPSDYIYLKYGAY